VDAHSKNNSGETLKFTTVIHPRLTMKLLSARVKFQTFTKFQNKIVPILNKINKRNLLSLNSVFLRILFIAYLLILVFFGLIGLLTTLILDIILVISLTIINWRILKIQRKQLFRLEQKKAMALAIEEERTRPEREFAAFKNTLQTLPTDELLEVYALVKETKKDKKYLDEVNSVMDLRAVSTESKQLAISNHKLEVNKLEMLEMQAQQREAQRLSTQQLNQELQRLLAEQNKRRTSWGFGVWF